MAENNRQQFLVVLPGGKLCQGEIYPAWLFKEAGVKQTIITKHPRREIKPIFLLGFKMKQQQFRWRILQAHF
jgi:hypothetical protein